MPYDLIIKNGHVITGKNDPISDQDIGIKSNLISYLGKNISETAIRVIDAKGMTVCPGFIDMHSHSDLEIVKNPKTEDKLLQGVTTEVIGNCGFSLFPISEEHKEEALDFLSLLLEGVEEKDLFANAGAYISHLNSQKTSTNIVSLVGHNMIRIAVNGYEEKISPAKLQECTDILSRELKAGIHGLSTGLMYTPACFSDIEELSQLAKVIKKKDGIFTWHMRDEGDYLKESIEEVIETSKQSKARMQISHLKVSGFKNWGEMPEILDMIKKAVDEGHDLGFDIYPYTFGTSTLMILLPKEIDRSNLINNLKNRDFREKSKKYLMANHRLLSNVGAENIVISSCRKPKNQKLVGKSLKELSKQLKKDISDIIFDLLIEEKGETQIFLNQMNEQDVKTALAHPLGCLGTDGIPRSGNRAHPRLRNSFLQMLSRYVQKEQLISMLEAIRKMTILPANRLKLKGRGEIKEGNFADLCIFDPDKNKMEYVIVNGQVAVEKGKYSGILAGEILNVELERALRVAKSSCSATGGKNI